MVARESAILNMIKKVNYEINNSELNEIGLFTEGYSFADLNAVVKDAAMEPIRDL